MSPDQEIQQQPQQGIVLTGPPAQRAPLREMLETLKDIDPALVKTFAQQIVAREVAATLFDQDARLAQSFAMSGLFENLRGVTPQEAMCKAMSFVQLGRSWGMEPADALQYIQFYAGKPSVANEYIAAKMRDAGLDWRFKYHRDASGECIGCTLYPLRRQADGSYQPIMDIGENGEDVVASVSFRKTDAQRIRTKEYGKEITLDQKSTYQAFPEDLYYWKCIVRLKRRYCTNIFSAVPSQSEAEEMPVPLPKVELKEPLKLAAMEDVLPVRNREPEPAAATLPEQSAQTQLTQILQESIAAVEQQKSDPLPTDRALLKEIFTALRVEADAKGDGLFMTQIHELDSTCPAPNALMGLSVAELQRYIRHLQVSAGRQWEKNAKDEWVKTPF